MRSYMREELVKEERQIKDELHITYYFTAFFTVLGTLLILFLLINKVEKISLFIIILSITAGGIPVGVIGAFIDYKISEYKFKYKKIV